MATLRKKTEDLVIQAIRGGLDYVRAVEPYNGEMGHAMTPDDLYQILRGRAPAVLVTTGDGTAETGDIQRRLARKMVDIDIVLISNDLRSREDRTRADRGIYEMAEDIEGLLIGRDSGIDGVGRLQLVAEKAILHRPELCAWTVRYQVLIDARADKPSPKPASLLELVGTFKLPQAEGGNALLTINEHLEGS